MIDKHGINKALRKRGNSFMGMRGIKERSVFLITVVACLFAGTIRAESEFFKKFKQDYVALDMDLLNNPGELATVKDFVYHKDVATFTFKEGIIHLLRYIDGRPTTAVFVGKGKAQIKIPSHMERQGLSCVTGDSLVDEDFEVAFIRMADDFDLKLKEKFVFEPKELPWKTFTIVKQAHGELFFRPRILHAYDNYFELLRSHYERSDDGFFWMDFNRYVFTFDPNRPEQVVIAYELGVADLIAKECAVFQRQEYGVYDDHQMSRIPYPTTIFEKHGTIEMTGSDGLELGQAEVTVRVLVNADSLRFMSLFLPSLLKEDSIYLNGQPVDYYRRKDFEFIGIVPPGYFYAEDTLEFTLWYRGKNFDRFLPYVENPEACPHTFTFIIPKGVNYYMPGMGEIKPLDNKRDQFKVTSPNLYNDFYFHAYASDIDTIPVTSDMGITLNFLKPKSIPKRLLTCYIPDDQFQKSITRSFNFLSSYLGGPPGTFEVYITPEKTATMPGLIQTPQTACVTEGPMEAMGGFDAVAAAAIARQWFGSLLEPASDRERWVSEAVPQYLALMFTQNERGAAYYINLLNRRDSIYTMVGLNRDMPLAAGERAMSAVRINKGVWLLHMLRFLMYDLETGTEGSFLRFLQDLAFTCNNRQFTNKGVIDLAEKQYGQPLDWFFQQWMYGRSFPEYQVEYKFVRQDNEYFVRAKVETKGVDSDFFTPVAMRVVDSDGHSTYFRKTISSSPTEFELGPFTSEPKEFVFNEFYSVLSKDNVKKK
jgi:hypothetical protein